VSGFTLPPEQGSTPPDLMEPSLYHTIGLVHALVPQNLMGDPTGTSLPHFLAYCNVKPFF
jgi:hypothetical protein